MRDKTTAGILALLLGVIGVHRFYLNQKGLGFVYILACFTGIGIPLMALVGFIDAIVFFTMDDDLFNMKYNRHLVDKVDYRRRARSGHNGRKSTVREYEPRQKTQAPRRPRPTRKPRKADPFLKSGQEKYEDFDFKGAIIDFKKSLGVRPNNPETHFRLACAYSMTEQVDEGFFHLDKAVALGMRDIDAIRTTDALAFLRISDQYDSFKANGYRLIVKEVAAPEVEMEMDDNFLEKLKHLGELRDRGFLSEEEFKKEKAKLMR